MADKEPCVIISLRKTIADLEHQHKVEAALKDDEYQTEISQVTKTYEAKLNFLKTDPNAVYEGEDVQFELDNGEKLRGHRFVLATKSPGFKEILKKKDTARNPRIYDIKETSSAIMCAVIGFCHTAEITFTEEVTASKVLKIAHLYQIDYLEEVCMEKLMKTRYKDNVQDTSSAVVRAVIRFCHTGEINFTEEITPLQVLKVAHDHKISALEEACLRAHMKTCSGKNVSHASSSSKSPQGDEEETSEEDASRSSSSCKSSHGDEEEKSKEDASQSSSSSKSPHGDEEETTKEDASRASTSSESPHCDDEETSKEELEYNHSRSGALEKDRTEIGPKTTKRTKTGGLEEQGQNLAKKVKIEASSDSENGALERDADLNALSNFNISEALRKALKSRGIETLLPIQAATVKSILDGKDVVARVSPCQSTTLSFVLPILESVKRNGWNCEISGRTPIVLVLTPTLDLAFQLRTDFNFYGDRLGLDTLIIQGGAASMHSAELKLSRGMDIVMGTPYWIKRYMADHKGSLNLKNLMFLVLHNLYVGNEDVKAILEATQDASRVQTLLFGEHMGKDTVETVERFMNPGQIMVHLVRDEERRASVDVKHYLMPCRYQTRALLYPDLVGDTISCHGKVESLLYSPKARKVLESLHFTFHHFPLIAQSVQPAESTAENQIGLEDNGVIIGTLLEQIRMI